MVSRIWACSASRLFRNLRPDRGVEKEFRHLHLGAGAAAAQGEGDLPGPRPPRAKPPVAPGGQVIRLRRLTAAMLGQGLAPEAQGGDVQQIGFGGQLAGGVAHQAQGGILAGSCRCRRPPPG